MAADIDIKRYRKLRAFFLKILVKTLWWDVLINRPILRRFRPEPIDRWRNIARQFRILAVEMGGVMIKLGQFLSIRVDILPLEITGELADLQDEVPPEPFESIAFRIASDFGRPVEEVFAWISPAAVGAASLAQVHRVRLETGENAVIKVLRPGIERRVETDLAAVKAALGWLKWYQPIERRVDTDWLVREFEAVTRRELDLTAEGKNAERLAEDFKDDPGVYIPGILWSHSAGGILAMEDVGYLKIGDLDALRQAGTAPEKVAERLYNLYMRQVFETHFVHVDPHPGNLFVLPLPLAEEADADRPSFGPGEPVPFVPDRPFKIVFVDFGMMAEIPDRLRSAVKEYAVGLGTRNARRIVSSYLKAGVLLPGADLKRLEEVHEALLDRFWGVQAGRLRDIAFKEARYFMREFGDIIRDAPFQFQADMMFVFRALGILSGMAAHLDPNFDVWSKTIPYARRYASEALRTGSVPLMKNVAAAAQAITRIPVEADLLIGQIRRGEVSVQMSPTGGTRSMLADIQRSIDRLGSRMLASALLISGALLIDTEGGGFLGKVFMAIGGLAALMSFRKR